MKETQKKAAEETEAVRRQKELIQMQMSAQQQLIQTAKDAASNPIVAPVVAAPVIVAKTADTTDGVNVMDINVEDDFDIDEIWVKSFLFLYIIC